MLIFIFYNSYPFKGRNFRA